MLSKSVDELQSGVGVGVSSIGGTLKYVTDYTGFSGDPTEQSGNYLVLHIDTQVQDATIKVQLIGGDHGEVTLDSDRTIILRIKNTRQKLRITVTADGYETVTKTYDLTGLRLESAS